MRVIIIALLLLFLGDFLSTFIYHIPQHVFGRLHLTTHHAGHQSFSHYAVLRVNSAVLLDGWLGALPYLLLAIGLGSLSVWGASLGLAIGQFHVWWRHTTALGWKTPPYLGWCCDRLGIVTPERHWQHHQKAAIGYGDIFTLFDQPGRQWLRWLRWVRRKVSLQL
jgi:hypothetical protein